MPKYTAVTIFTKKGNLLQFANHARKPMLDPITVGGQQYYSKEREIQQSGGG